jgi:hypothetical protein
MASGTPAGQRRCMASCKCTRLFEAGTTEAKFPKTSALAKSGRIWNWWDFMHWINTMRLWRYSFRGNITYAQQCIWVWLKLVVLSKSYGSNDKKEMTTNYQIWRYLFSHKRTGGTPACSDTRCRETNPLFSFWFLAKRHPRVRAQWGCRDNLFCHSWKESDEVWCKNVCFSKLFLATC